MEIVISIFLSFLIGFLITFLIFFLKEKRKINEEENLLNRLNVLEIKNRWLFLQNKEHKECRSDILFLISKLEHSEKTKEKIISRFIH